MYNFQIMTDPRLERIVASVLSSCFRTLVLGCSSCIYLHGASSVRPEGSALSVPLSGSGHVCPGLWPAAACSSLHKESDEAGFVIFPFYIFSCSTKGSNKGLCWTVFPGFSVNQTFFFLVLWLWANYLVCFCESVS